MPDRRNVAPRSVLQNERLIVREVKNFAKGSFNDGPAASVPPGGLYDLINGTAHPWGAQGRAGNDLLSAALPAILTGKTISKSGTTVTISAGGTFGDNEGYSMAGAATDAPVTYVGTYIVYDDGFNERILSYTISPETGVITARVGSSTAHAASTAGKIRGEVFSYRWHPVARVMVLHIGDRIFTAPYPFTTWTRVYRNARTRPPWAKTTMRVYGNDMLLFSSAGIFSVELSGSVLRYKLINAAVPDIRQADENGDAPNTIGRRMTTCFVELSGDGGCRERITAGVETRHESGSVHVKSMLPIGSGYSQTGYGLQDYWETWNASAVGPIRLRGSTLYPNIAHDYHWTHYSVWGTVDMGPAGVDPITGQANNPERFGWMHDVPLVKLGTVVRGSGESCITSTPGMFQTCDAGAVVRINTGISPHAVSRTYYLLNNGIPAYRYMQPTDPAIGEDNETSGVLGAGDNQLLLTYGSHPTQECALRAGVHTLRLVIEKTGGADPAFRSACVYWKLYELKADTSEVLLMTSSTSGAITTTATFNISAVLAANVTIANDSVFLLKVYANIGITGTDVSLKFYYYGATNAALTLLAYSTVAVETVETITQFVNERVASTSGLTELQSGSVAVIGSSRYSLASQSANVLTATASIFAYTDVGKIIWFSDGTWDLITKYVSATSVQLARSRTLTNVWFALDPIARAYCDDITDDDLRYRMQDRGNLKQRFLIPMPNCDLGAVTPGIVFGACDHAPNYFYSETAEKSLVGYYFPGWQNGILSDECRDLSEFENTLIVYCSRGWALFDLTSAVLKATDPVDPTTNNGILGRMPILQLTSRKEVPGTGILSRGAFVKTRAGFDLVLTQTRELRIHDGLKFGNNLIADRYMKKFGKLQSAAALHYDPLSGVLVFGTETVEET